MYRQRRQAIEEGRVRPAFFVGGTPPRRALPGEMPNGPDKHHACAEQFVALSIFNEGPVRKISRQGSMR
ncbi:hypothetical protein [Jiella mangrovi]|uniref:Uncharacterized protein n=1 Tax=Jiella mangrovi TaxID=2821407 RepID=A0ABS4BMA4_9HYPH|nr:hypothetical protein [Jiella mangrovi]MBP0617863.1 hypothetical protein [Jiella mangrovi]